MKREDLERMVLELWMKSRIPLTKAHLQYYTRVKRRQLDKWLDELVVEGVLDLDVTDDGDMEWRVPGAQRPIDGPETFERFEKLQAMRDEARRKVRARAAGRSKPAGEDRRPKKEKDDDDGPSNKLALSRKALSVAGKAADYLDKPRGEGEKSLLLSAGLSLFGPLGWLYAGSFKETIPAILLYLGAAAIIPTFLLMPIMWVALPLSSIAGLVYAWQYNRKGKRSPIFLGDGSDDE